MDREKTSCSQNKRQPIIFNNLSFIKCVFLTNTQFNVNKIHIPKQSLFLEEMIYVSALSDIENKINGMIDNIYYQLNANNNGTPYKIPMPIFLLLGKALEYEKSILEGETFIHTPIAPNGYKIGKSTITTGTTGNIAILDYINAFFSSGLETKQDKDKYNTSIINTYKFKGNVKIFLYVPYLTKNYKYVSNFTDIINSSRFFYSLINTNYFLSFQKTSNINQEFIAKLRKSGVNEKIINKIIDIFNEADRKKYTLYDDLVNLCFEGGCVSDVGEDLERLIPQYTDDEGKNTENAKKYSPYMPSKCLSKTNGYLCNVKYADENNIDIHDFLKRYSMKELKVSLGRYTEINNKIENNEDVSNNVNEIDKYKSPVDLIISVVNKYIKDGYSDNLKDETKDIKIKRINADGEEETITEKTPLNHYSKDFSENIIKELSLLHKLHPGVPEIVLSLYLFNETYKPDKIIYMPFGRFLLSNSYVLNVGEQLMVNKRLFSINNRFALTINNYGYIYVYDRTNMNVLYFLNRKTINNTKGMIIEKNGIGVVFIDDNNNEKTINVMGDVKSLIKECDNCIDPYNAIIDNDSGNIIIYGNAFYNATNDSFQNFINNERKIMKNMNTQDKQLLKIDNLDKIIKEDEELLLRQQENYLYCNSLNEGCIK